MRIAPVPRVVRQHPVASVLIIALVSAAIFSAIPAIPNDIKPEEVAADSPSTSVSFEVFGDVQGVFFRKYTQKKAQRLGLVGWCENTREGTVVGVVQGPQPAVQVMKHWLEHKGSPMSTIVKTIFSDEKEIEQSEFSSFEIKR